MGKKSSKNLCFSRSWSSKWIPLPPSLSPPVSAAAEPTIGKGAKKKTGTRLWLRYDREWRSRKMELDKGAIIKLVEIPMRDFRILGTIFSQSSNIPTREKAMVINLEFIKTIVTAEEVLVLDPMSHEVIPFIEQLRQ